MTRQNKVTKIPRQARSPGIYRGASCDLNNSGPMMFPAADAALNAERTTLFFVDPAVLAVIHDIMSGFAPYKNARK